MCREERELMRAFLIGSVLLVLAIAPAAAQTPNSCDVVKRELTYGRVALERAKNKTGLLKSAQEFENAAQKAPTCDQAQFNMGVVYEKAGEFAKARQAFAAYLKLAPGAADAAKVQEKIYELEYLARESSGSGGEKAAGWGAFAGTWCDVKTCDDPQWGTSAYDYRVNVTGDQIVIAQKYRMRRGNYASDQYAIYRGTVGADGKLRGRHANGTTMVTNRECRGQTLEDTVDFSGELKKDTVIDAQGREISGGVILLKWNGWTTHNFNYTRCTKDRAPDGSWSLQNILLKRRN